MSTLVKDFVAYLRSFSSVTGLCIVNPKKNVNFHESERVIRREGISAFRNSSEINSSFYFGGS